MSSYESPSPTSSSQLFRVLLDKYWKGKISGDQFVDIVSNPAHTESFPCLCSASSASSAHSIAESEPPIFAATSISLGFWKTVEAITDASETLNPKSANIPMFALIYPHHYPATVPRRFVRTERSVRLPDTPLPTIVEEPSPVKA